MPSLTTRCPQCGTAFKVVADQLRVRQGLVRCGVCSAVFDGYARLIGEADTATTISAPTAPPPAPSAPPARFTPSPAMPVPSPAPAPPTMPVAPVPAPTTSSLPAPPPALPPVASEPPWAMPRAYPVAPADPVPAQTLPASPSGARADTASPSSAALGEVPAVLRDRSHAARRAHDDTAARRAASVDDRDDDDSRDNGHDDDRERDHHHDDQAAGLRSVGFRRDSAHANDYRDANYDYADQHVGTVARDAAVRTDPSARIGAENRSDDYRSDDYASKDYLVQPLDIDREIDPVAGGVDDDSERDTPPAYVPVPSISQWDNRREPAVFAPPRAAASASRSTDQWGRGGTTPREAAVHVDDDAAPGYDDAVHDDRYAPDARDVHPARVTHDADSADDPVARDDRDHGDQGEDGENDDYADEGQDAAPIVRGETRVRHAGDPHAGATPPEFMDDEVERQGTFGRWFWGMACIVAVVALALASIWTYRNSIVTSAPQLRPVLAQLCARMGCEVGYARRIDRIAILSSSLQPPAGSFAAEPGRSRLILRLVIRNRYSMPQPLPALTLELTDFSDTIVARKVLRPDMYLPVSVASQPFAAEGELSVAVPIDVTDLQVNGYQVGKFFP